MKFKTNQQTSAFFMGLVCAVGLAGCASAENGSRTIANEVQHGDRTGNQGGNQGGEQGGQGDHGNGQGENGGGYQGGQGQGEHGGNQPGDHNGQGNPDPWQHPGGGDGRNHGDPNQPPRHIYPPVGVSMNHIGNQWGRHFPTPRGFGWLVPNNWNWAQINQVTCTAEDEYGDQYPVNGMGYSRFQWQGPNVINSLQQGALDECYNQSPVGNTCTILSCTPVYY